MKSSVERTIFFTQIVKFVGKNLNMILIKPREIEHINFASPLALRIEVPLYDCW